MTKNVVTVEPDAPLIEAVNLIIKGGFSGLPVTVGKMLVGIITEYDLIAKGSGVHIPTLLKIFNGLNQKNSEDLKEQLKEVITMKVADAMNSDPLTLAPEDSLLKVVDTFTQHHRVNPIPIILSDKSLVGIISRSDMLKFFGDSNLNLSKDMDVSQINKNVDQFIHNFEKKFVLVTVGRTRWWLLASLLFALAGFVIAWLLIVRVNL